MGFITAPIKLDEWSEIILDGWVFLCLVSFIGFAVFTDREKRRRKSQLFELHIPTTKEGSKTDLLLPEHIRQWTSRNLSQTQQQELSNSSSIGGEDSSFPSSNNSDRTLPVTETSADKLVAQQLSPPGLLLSLPPLPSTGHRVIFQSHPTGEISTFEPIDSPPSLKISISPVKSTSASSPGIPRRTNSPAIDGNHHRVGGAFFPFLGKRLTRDHSETSLNSLPSILRVNSGRKTPPTTTPPAPAEDNGGSRNSSPTNTEGSTVPTTNREKEINNIALEMDECSVCFEALHKEPVAICANGEGLPVCLHIYHDRCIRFLRRRRCILCGAAFRYRRRLPDFEIDPQGWFQSVDVDRSGGLSSKEIGRILAAQLPIDRLALEALLIKNWARWDADKSGEIDQSEFFNPRRGLLVFIKKKKKSVQKI
jgi:hypothetical protein